MIRLLVHLAALPFCLTELSKNSVQQSPTALIKHAGEEVLMSCNHSNTNFDMMQWYKQSAGKKDMALVGYVRFTAKEVEDQFKDVCEITGDGGSLSKLKIAKSRSEDSAVYFCGASNTGNYEPAYFGSGTKLTVLEKGRDPQAPTVTVFPASKKECRNKVEKQKRKKTLLCVISGFYPDHVKVSWKVNDETRTEGVATDNMPAKPNDGEFYKITSRLKVPTEKWFDPNNNFSCIANFYNGKNNTDYVNWIEGIEVPKTGKNITTEAYLRRSQAAKLSYGVLIVKGCVYGAFVMFLAWKLPGSSGKRNN